MRTLAALLVAVSAFAATPPVPRPAKELTVDQGGGKKLLLSQYRGKVVIIQFLFTTCPHCQALSRVLTKFQQDMGPKVQVLGVAFDDGVDANTANTYVRQYGVGFPVGFAPRDTVINYLGLSVMDRLSVPQVMIIDQKGVVRAQSEPSGTAQLQDANYLKTFVGDMLKGGPAAPAAKSTPPANASKPGGKS